MMEEFAETECVGKRAVSRRLDVCIQSFLPLKALVAAFETRVIIDCLARNEWKKSHAARELGLSRMGLDKKLHRYGIDVKALRAHP